jgi:NhaP-type Na+/H+ or K+/H+ antiporter
MPVLPAHMVLDGDLDGIAKLALHDLDAGILALFVLTSCAVVGRSLWAMVSFLNSDCSKRKDMSNYSPTRETTIVKGAKGCVLECDGTESACR